MRLVIQRVEQAEVHIKSQLFSSIKKGLLIFSGIEEEDNDEDIQWLASKVCNMRLFSDEEGKMNLDVKQVNGNILLVSQFTLLASTKKGNRPSFIKAARPEKAIPIYKKFIKTLELMLEKSIQTGEFGADMQIKLINDGPVTIIMDSKVRE
ncbi:MAG: D-tyrosyl-tRNA(Tyr) deacylase [Bacteroidetes bacterium]|nr:D-tyrosyl-tRNA(Tyr) deacylase [Bacteroidota bacterium]